MISFTIYNIFWPKKNFFKLNFKSKRGQTLVEYALILAFISVVAIAVLIRLGHNVSSVFSAINSQLQVAQLSH